MPFLCCGVKYSKADPETYWCIETDLVKNYAFTKKNVNGDKVHKEVIETLVCKKHGCMQVHIKRYGKLKGRYKILEMEKLSGNEAALFLIETEKIRIRQLQICPVKSVPYAKRLPSVYLEIIKQNPDCDIARYCYIMQGKNWCDKFSQEEGSWKPDITEIPILFSQVS